MNKMVSIIVCVYNGEKYINKCIESLINQSYNNLQIVVIEDGSTDNTRQLLSMIEDERIEKYYQKNEGLAISRNKGLKIARGEYIVFVDADDYIHEQFVEKMVLESELYNADIVVCNFTMDETELGYKKDQGICVLSDNEQSLDKLLCKDIPDFCWGKIYKKQIIKNMQFPEKKLFEDIYLMYNLVLESEVVVIVPEILYYYNTKNNDSILRGSITVSHVDCIYATFKRYEHIKKVVPDLKNKAYNKYLESARALYIDTILSESTSNVVRQEILDTIRFVIINRGGVTLETDFKNTSFYVMIKFFPNAYSKIVKYLKRR